MSEDYVCPLEDPSLPDGVAGGRLLVLAKAGLDLTIAVAAVLVNGFILWAVLPGVVRRTVRRRGRPSRVLVASLAMADALSGVVQFNYHLTQNVCWLAHWTASHHTVCIVKLVSVVFTGMVSINSLAAIGFDRYLCIVHSLRYLQIMTTRRAWYLVAFVWAESVVGASLLAVGNRWHAPETACIEKAVLYPGILIAVITPMNMADLVVIAVTHLFIRREVGRSMALHQRGSGSGGEVADDAVHSCDAVHGAGRRYSSGSVKSAKVLLLVVGCYMLAYVPVLIVMVLRSSGLVAEQHLEWPFRFGYSVASLNNVVNPFTYAWKNESLKADMLALWASLSLRHRRRSHPLDAAVLT